MRDKINRRHISALLVFFLISVSAGIIENRRQLFLRDDQIILASMVLKDMDPALYPHDPVLSSDHYRIYAPAVRAILVVATRITGEIEAAHRLIVPVVLFVFLTAFYVFLHAVTGHAPVSILVAILAAPRRQILPASAFFGVFGIQSLLIRTFFLALFPLVLWLFWRWRDSNRVLWAFLALGVLANFHPTSGYSATVMLVALLLLHRGLSRQTILLVLAGGILALVGISPFLWSYANYPQELLVGGGLLPTVVLYPVTPERFAGRGYVFPIPSNSVLKSVLLGADVLLFSALALAMRWKRRGSEDRYIIHLIASVLLATLGGTAALQLFGWLRGQPVWHAELMRGMPFIYFPLYVATALFFIELGRVISRPFPRRFYVLAFAAILLFFPLIPGLQLFRSLAEERQTADLKRVAAAEELVVGWFYQNTLRALPERARVPLVTLLARIPAGKAAQLIEKARLRNQHYRAVGNWLLANSAVTDRVLAENPHVRLSAQRELGEQIIPDAIPSDVLECYEIRNVDCLVAAAGHHSARFIVVFQTFPALPLPVVFENGTYRIYEVVNKALLISPPKNTTNFYGQ
ncbi:MAG: hypothetical protein L0332_01030 [Chloroflexi bacterium]|nr:hypothetical protein [Chloroflexota bacterium]MCI0725306.1 hypothetical protein [Chloroflexota bacterium]